MTLATVDRYDSEGVSRVGGRAVVAGASMAGLCAARALADGFDEVVVIEPDPLPDEPVERDGAPQTSHPHVLLEGGRATLADFFPGFGEDLIEAGGLMVDSATQMVDYQQGDFVTDGPERAPTYCASRPLFEFVVRRRVRGLDAVRLWPGCQVTGYQLDDAGTTVTGATVRTGDGTTETVDADLVVDATGRTSRTPQWLDEHGYRAPPEDEVRVDLSYSSIRIERPPGDRRMFNVPAEPPRTRGAAVVPIEDGQWDVILQGIHGDEAPTEPGDVQAFAESLPVPELADLLRDQPWVSDGVDHYPFPASLRRRYEALDRFPEGLVVTGDAISSFNPVYGQGMSVAALDALVLHHAIADGGLDGIGRRFFDEVTAVVDVVWRMAVGADFQFPQTSGPKPTGTDLFNWYVTRLTRQAHTDGVVSDAFARVFRLEESPTTLFRPRVLWRVLRPTGGG